MPFDRSPSGSDFTGLDKLRKEIESLRRDAIHNTHYFNPQTIRDLGTPALIKAAVDDCLFPEFKKDWICRWINQRGILTFCILVHIEKEKLFTAFLERDVDKKLDDQLPLDAKTLQSISPEEGRKFFDVQWQFLPIILPKREYLQIADERIMPFMEDHHDGDHDGAFGDIYKVTIDSSMQNAIEVDNSDRAAGKPIVFVRKQIRFKQNNEGFARERKCLEILQQLKHPNIVDLLCSYTYRGEHSLIFPCEDMDLDEFLNLPERYREFASNHTFYSAIYGLISAVEYVHSCKFGDEEGDFATIIGYHHDIRPRNILVRSNTFLLADFGLANMSEEGQSSTSVKGGGGQYMAPECINKGHIGRAADIWSLGGVIVDIAAYIALGRLGRIAAEDQREGGPYVDATTTHFFADGKVKPGVINTIKALQQNPEDKTLRSLLLVSESMLNVQQDKRPNAHTVRRDIAYVSIKSLFRAALQGMKDWRQRSGESDAGRIWEDTWKLWAWGEEVGINGANRATEKFKSALPRAHQDEKKLQHILQDLVRLLDSLNRIEAREVARRGSNRTSTPGQYYGQEATNVNDRIRDLRTTLPDDYGTRIKGRKAHYGRFATDPPGLPDIADDALEASSQHKRSLTLPLLNETMLARTSTDPVLGTITARGQVEPIQGKYKALAEQQSGVGSLVRKAVPLSAPQIPDAPNALPRFETRTSQPPEAHIPASSTTSSLPIVGYGVVSVDQEQRRSPTSDHTISLATTPGTNLFSQNSRSGNQTSATSRNPSGVIGHGIQPSDRNKALPPKPPGIKLPSPQRDDASSEHGPFLIGTGFPAKVYYGNAAPEQCNALFDIHVSRSEDATGDYATIYCESNDAHMSLRQDLRESDSRYPHTERFGAEGNSVQRVYFLGEQVMHERPHLHTAAACSPQDQRPLGPDKVKVETRDVCYAFISSDDCKSFQQAVWGQDLLECLGAIRVIWPAVKHAISVNVSLWKSRSAPDTQLTVSFRGRMKQGQNLAMCHLRLSKSNTDGGRQSDEKLHLKIELPVTSTPELPMHEPKPKTKQKGFKAKIVINTTFLKKAAPTPELIIVFGSVTGSSAATPVDE